MFLVRQFFPFRLENMRKKRDKFGGICVGRLGLITLPDFFTNNYFERFLFFFGLLLGVCAISSSLVGLTGVAASILFLYTRYTAPPLVFESGNKEEKIEPTRPHLNMTRKM